MNAISKVETFLIPPRWLFVRVETADGIVGWGEASLEGHAEAVEGVFASFRDRFIGTDASKIEDVWQTAYRLGFYRGGPVLMSALSGLDQALWDIKGKEIGRPVWQLLGGAVREDVRVYAWVGGDTPSEVVEQAQRRQEQGFGAVKMNASGLLEWLDSPKSLDEIAARVASVKALGLDVAVDFHGRVHKPMVRRLAALLEPLGPLFIEEPLLSEHPEALRQLALQTVLPVALGERLYSRWDFKPFFEDAIVDIAQPDLAHAGGISECRRIAALAEAYDVAIAPHCPLGPIAFAACIQIAATTPNFVIQEMPLGIHYNSQEHDLFTYLCDPKSFATKNGMIAIPSTPGLGIAIDEQRVRHAAQTPHRWRNPAWRGSDGSIAEW